MKEASETLEAERAFDEAYYLACYSDILPKNTDPVEHFQKTGWKSGLNPNPFFSTKLYASANPKMKKLDGNPFEHFVQNKTDSAAFVSALFDSDYYIMSASRGADREDAIHHYWRHGRFQGRSPNILFDVPFYRAQLKQLQGSIRDEIDFLTHYLETGWKMGLSPHPLFDPEFYRSQLRGPALLIPPLAHYLEAGWRVGLTPNILFDPEYYTENIDADLTEPPLVHYLKRETWDGTPHYLFSDVFYVAAVQKSSLKDSPNDFRGGSPLLHYIRFGARHGISTHPLFDLKHYADQANLALRDMDDPEVELSLLKANPLKHYCDTGIALGLSPTPLFDTHFYQAQFEHPIAGDCLRHYLSPTGYSVASPHPAIDIDYYAKLKPDFAPSDLPVILDLLMTPRNDRVPTHPSFDPQYYLDHNPDIRDEPSGPIQHFLEHGMKEGRQPNRCFSYPYAHRLCQPGQPRYGNPVDGYLRARGHQRKRVLFLGHDASRSGAPLVLLALVKQLSAVADIECITVLGAGGPLTDDFVDVSMTYIAVNQDREFLEWNRHSAAFLEEMALVADMLEENPPALIVCNSLESSHLADFFVSRGFGPLITLVHEVADPYDAGQLSRLLNSSELSVFVSEYQFDRMRKKLVFDENKTKIVQFGSLDPWFGTGDRTTARHNLRASLGLSDRARIVLGCGTMNFRKGIDLFAEVACNVMERTEGEEDVHFVWVGGGPTHYDSAFYWAEKSVRDRNFETRVHFLGERSDTEPFFLAADLFLMTSRADPFPCVIQEAMSSGVPIVSFAGKSGASEAYGSGGVTVPFGVSPMADATCELLGNARRLEGLRKRCTEIQKAKWPLSGYADAIFKLAATATPTLEQELGSDIRQAGAAREDRPEVLIAMASWDCNEQSILAEHAAKLLDQQGYDAQILFTRGTGIFNRNDRPIRFPSVPFSFLFPKTQSEAHVREALNRRFANSRRRAVFIPFADISTFEVLTGLPRHVSTMALVHGQNDIVLDQIRRHSREFDHIVCTSSGAKAELLQSSSEGKDDVSFVTTRMSVDTKSSQRANAARSKRTVRDPIEIACSGFANLDAVLNCMRLGKLLREDRVPYRMSMFTNLAEMRTIRSIAPDLLQSKIVTLIESPGALERLEVLERSDVLVFGSEAAGTELGIAEAMAVGCVPVVPRADAGHVEALADGISCYLVDSAQTRKIAQLLGELQRDRKRLSQMAVGASRAFSAHFAGEERMAKELAKGCDLALKHREQRKARNGKKSLQVLHGA